MRGDVITFVREKEQLDFVGSVEWLANKANVNLRYTDAGGGEERRRRTMLQEAVGKAVAWLEEFRAFWAGSFDQLDGLLANLQHQEKKDDGHE